MQKIYITILFIYLGFTSLAQTSIDFKAENTYGCKSVITQFLIVGNTSGITGYYWEFGNGKISILASPQVSFTQTGKYTVKLSYNSNGVKKIIEKKNYIEVFELPTIFITATDTIGCLPLTTNFKAKSITTIPITNYKWDFSDGTSDNSINPIHQFIQSGNYLIQLKIQDANGCKNVISYNHKINVLPIPNVDFTTDIDSTCNKDNAFNFINQSSGLEPLIYNWDFGNNKTSSQKSPTQISLKTYHPEIKLTVTDKNLCSNTITFNNKPVIIELTAAFTPSKKTACLNNQIIFNNTSIGATSYKWDFGDNSYSSLKSPIHNFSKAGTFIISLVVTNQQNCISEYTDTITIEEIKAAFETSTDYICQLPQIVDYTNKSINATAWLWTFGDGMKTSEQNPKHTYFITNEIQKTNTVFYNTRLIAISKNGCKDTSVIKNNMQINLPKAYFTPNNDINNGLEYLVKGCVPLKIIFKNNSIYNSTTDSIKSWYWNMGDGKSYTSEDVTHTYTTDSIFKITMTIETFRGCITSYTSGAKAGTKQKASFTLDGTSDLCASTYAHLINNSTDIKKVDEWLWTFNNGQTYNDMQHPYVDLSQDTGLVDVKLSVGYNGCISDPTIKNDLIHIKAPIARFTYSFNCDKPLKYTFSSILIGCNNFKWDFGDGTYDTINPNPEHTYKIKGFYKASIIAYNTLNNCNYTYSKYIFIKEIKAVISTDKKAICKGESILLNSTASIDYYNYKYWTIINNNQLIQTLSDTIKYTFPTDGRYTARLVAIATNGCSDTAYSTISVFKPKANFSMTSPIGCTPLTVTFKDSSQSDTLITSYKWYLGNDKIAYTFDTINTFSTNGTYSPSLVIKDIVGCTDSITKKNTIISSMPTADFTISDSTLCIDTKIETKNNSKGNKLTYTWFTNAIKIDTVKDLITIAKDTGINNIKLITTDLIGCKDTMIKKVIVQIAAVTRFHSDLKNNTCYPAQINFINDSQSNYNIQYLWDFGDNGPPSIEENPIKYYNNPGNFSVRLISSTSFGCKDSLIIPNMITIGGPKADIKKNKDTLCIHDSIQLSIVNKQNIYKYIWDMGDGNMYTNETIKHNYNNAGTKYPTLLLFVDSIHTCDKFITDTIKIYDLISNNNNDTLGCVPLNIDMSYILTSAETWMWTTPDSTTTENYFTFINPGKYNFKLHASNFLGCNDSTTINIIAKKRPEVTIQGKTIICKGETSNLKTNNGKAYKWESTYPIQNRFQQEIAINPTTTCTYNITLTNEEGCSESSTIKINVQQTPVIDLMEDTTIIIGYSFNLTPLIKNASIYKWTPSTGIVCDICCNTLAKPLQTTTYTLNATDSNHCFTTQKEINITVKDNCTISLPDYFTPNNDGFNDIIYARGNGIKELFSFKIYNEWGEEVFSTNNITIGWNGFFKGRLQNKGTYVYTIKARTFKETIIEQKGNFTLM